MWPWLVQAGWHRAGWYTPHWVDRLLFPATHLPGAWRARLGASIDWTWTFLLTGTGDGGTRLQLRVRGRTRPWWLTAAYVAALVPADHVMAAGMLAGICHRAAPVSGWGPDGRPGS